MLELESFKTSKMMLEMAKKLRLEREREGKITRQIQEQKNQMANLDQRISREQEKTKEMRRAATGSTPEGNHQQAK
ncbi:unnamed protein product [Protopolystoma xenopodis]|uniref:Uncharacterized protein n=1 Tax=Protopolystoma xenopodis TaxID=117903 RepID=A0A448WIK1_9PLAT|nr:unnamed protein product [Protopolystoma xenopodis]